MCGIMGVVGRMGVHVNQLIYDGLTVLQHRGQDAAGIMTDYDGQFRLRKSNGLVSDIFYTRHMQRLEGHIGLGHVRYPTAGSSSKSEAQPFYVNSPYGLSIAHNGNLSIAALDSFKPWFASEFITMAAAKSADLSSELSADEALKSRAMRDKKNIIYLETVEEQILASVNLSHSTQISILTESLEGFNSLGDDLNSIAKSWALGRTDYLSRELVETMKYKSPEFYNSLILERNKKWLDKLIFFIEGSGTGFAAVGISHLLGEDSLIEMLRKQGYEVSRYYAFQGPNVIRPINPSIEKPN